MRRKKLTRPAGVPKDAEGWSEVYWSTNHHGQIDHEHPWCHITRSDPGTPGEPSNGIRYLRSYATREQAVQAVAASRVGWDRKVIAARKKLDEAQKAALERLLMDVDLEAPTPDGLTDDCLWDPSHQHHTHDDEEEK